MATTEQPSPGETADTEGIAVAFGFSAAVTVLFNTVLTFAKEAYEPLNSSMASLTGHHWWTHGLLDLIVFLAVGWALRNRYAGKKLTNGNTFALAASVVVAAAGLAGWFALV